MIRNKNYYQILEIKRDASSKEIKEAYRKLVKKYHPDKGGNSKKFMSIKEAYEILSVKDKKEEYDKNTFDSTKNKSDNEKVNMNQDFTEEDDLFSGMDNHIFDFFTGNVVVDDPDES